jgi:large subunit ribosomal protein L21e
MTRSKGKRSNTRSITTRSFRKHGSEHLSSYFQNFKLGDYVDISINSCTHKGMPFKFYHGKTGKIFNIAKSSVGVKIEKKVGNRKILKKINIRIEHLKKSKSKVEFSNRIKSKDKTKTVIGGLNDSYIFFRKKPCLQSDDHFVSFKKIKTVDPEPFCVVV